jgi:hypothetical protein
MAELVGSMRVDGPSGARVQTLSWWRLIDPASLFSFTAGVRRMLRARQPHRFHHPGLAAAEAA